MEKAVRLNTPMPQYEFLELIGKGSFGRVFKRLVAVYPLGAGSSRSNRAQRHSQDALIQSDHYERLYAFRLTTP